MFSGRHHVQISFGTRPATYPMGSLFVVWEVKRLLAPSTQHMANMLHLRGVVRKHVDN